MSRLTNIITGLIGLICFAAFTFGLSYTISDGHMVGWIKGIPLMAIVLFVIGLAAYNFYEDAIRKGDVD